MWQNNRCFYLIGPRQCQNVAPVALFIFTQNFVGLFFVVLQRFSFSCPYSGNTMRSALLKRSVKRLVKLPAAAMTATSLPKITLVARRQKQFDIFVFNYNAVSSPRVNKLWCLLFCYCCCFLIYPPTFQKFI